MKLSWPKYEIIKKVNGLDVLYLRRYFIWRSDMFNVYLHYIPLPDQDKTKSGSEDCSHNHPWDFISFVLWGGYTEGMYSEWNVRTTLQRKWLSFGKRKAQDFHKILDVKPNTWTLVITGPVKNEWGFLEDTGFTHYMTFLGLKRKIDMD